MICLNCHETRSLAAGTADSVKLQKFFDKVIERKCFPRGEHANDKRRFTTQYSTALPSYVSNYKTTSDNLL